MRSHMVILPILLLSIVSLLSILPAFLQFQFAPLPVPPRPISPSSSTILTTITSTTTSTSLTSSFITTSLATTIPPSMYNEILIWNMPSLITIPDGKYATEQMLDAFDNHIIIDSQDNITVRVMTFNQFHDFPNNYWGTNSSVIIYSGMHIDFWFNESEGCSAYMYVVYGSRFKTATFTPYVTAKYNPSSYLKGVCK